MTDHHDQAEDHVPLDPSDPVDRRVQLVMQDLRVTADDLGTHGIDALRHRLSQPDGRQIAATIAHRPAPADPIADGIRDALKDRHASG